MKVLLINPKIPDGRPWLPVGLLCLGSYLRKHGIESRLIDGNFKKLDHDCLSRLLSDYEPDIVGIGAMTVQCKDAMRIGTLVRAISSHPKIVFGGVHFTFRPEDGLVSGDIVVVGEGEQAFLEICEGRKLSQIKGIIYRDDSSKVTRTEPRELMKELDEVPFPAYDLVDVSKYDDRLITGERAISIMTGRGCPYDCSFCASPRFWKRRVRFHSLDYVLKHLNYLVAHYDLKNLRIMDDTFTASRERVLKFCELVETNGLKLNMSCLTNVRNADYEMFKRMKQAGFSIVALGVESGNDTILRMINKGTTRDEARKAVKNARDAGLKAELLFMIGNIGESYDKIMDSIEFAKEINPAGPSDGTAYNWFQFATPFPGSRFYENAHEYGTVVTRDWDRYGHQEPVFVPRDLDSGTMIMLREKALRETNYHGPLSKATMGAKNPKKAVRYLSKKIRERFPKKKN